MPSTVRIVEELTDDPISFAEYHGRLNDAIRGVNVLSTALSTFHTSTAQLELAQNNNVGGA